MTLEIAVAGANGFIGRHVVAALRDDSTRDVVELVRDHGGQRPSGFDLRDRASVDAALQGRAVVVHSASYVGRDPDVARAVNVEGTRNLVSVAREGGVARIVYVSTAAVYGRGPFTGLAEANGTFAPASSLSRTRAQAEQLVLDAGGIVVRPHLVVGVGDRWVLPSVARLLSTLGAHINDGVALHSTIHVADLGRVIAWLATQPDIERGSYHVSASAPISARELSTWAEDAGLSKPAEGSVSLKEAQRMLSKDSSLKSSASLLGINHVFDARKLEQAGYPCTAARTALVDVDLAWYRGFAKR